jgi:hypothetical protein
LLVWGKGCLGVWNRERGMIAFHGYEDMVLEEAFVDV